MTLDDLKRRVDNAIHVMTANQCTPSGVEVEFIDERPKGVSNKTEDVRFSFDLFDPRTLKIRIN